MKALQGDDDFKTHAKIVVGTANDADQHAPSLPVYV